jgi:outer membrane receptor protein involved in Fe transport
VSRAGGGHAGASYFRELGTHSNDFILPLAGEDELRQVSAHSRSQAAYAQLRWRPGFLGGRLEATAAGRYTRDNKDAERSITFNSTDAVETNSLSHLSYNRVTPEFSLAYHWSEGISTYAKVATGYQAGGALESAPANQFGANTFRPETSTTYEVGLQSTFNDYLHADVTLFDSKRRNVQYALPVNLIFDEAFEFQRVTSFGTLGGVAVPSGYTSRAGAWAEPLTYGLNITFAY